MTYSEKLKDPRWQKKRLDILERDEFTCQLCKDTKTELHVHHFIYSKNGNPWDVIDYALTTYCKHCHAVVEYNKNYSPLEIYKVPLKDNSIQLYVINMEEDDVDMYQYDEYKNIVTYLATISDTMIKLLFDYLKSRLDFRQTFQNLINEKINA